MDAYTLTREDWCAEFFCGHLCQNMRVFVEHLPPICAQPVVVVAACPLPRGQCIHRPCATLRCRDIVLELSQYKGKPEIEKQIDTKVRESEPRIGDWLGMPVRLARRP
jgi:hypothetical protein